ncbi:MAG: carboxypeptidase regulatory-like domain-containing protein [Planctomycetes bacterium]|nr:carboxypeptidase regulatory-like domain-containing protein [Planctomycetota bacterium]
MSVTANRRFNFVLLVLCAILGVLAAAGWLRDLAPRVPAPVAVSNYDMRGRAAALAAPDPACAAPEGDAAAAGVASHAPSRNDAARVAEGTPGPDVRSTDGPRDRGDGWIRGRVVDSEQRPVAGASVRLSRRDGMPEWPSYEGADLAGTGDAYKRFFDECARQSRFRTTDAEGRFEFKGLDAGRRYDLWATCRGLSTEGESSLSCGEELVVWLKPRQMLRGHVRDESGKPVTSFVVHVDQRQDSHVSYGSEESFHSEDGAFAMTIGQGTPRLRVQAPGYCDSGWVDVVPDAEGADVEVVLKAAPVLEVLVRDAAGTPLSRVAISAERLDAKPDEDPWYHDEDQCDTNLQGRLLLRSLAPGRYRVHASYGAAGAMQEVELSGSGASCELTLERGCVVVVAVKDAKGKPVPDPQFDVRHQGNDVNCQRRNTAEPGVFRLEGLPAGEVVLMVGSYGVAPFVRTLQLVSGETRVDAALGLGAKLAGRVCTADGKPLRDVALRLMPAPGNETFGVARFNVDLQDDSTFSVGPIPVGEWDLEVYAGRWNYSDKMQSLRLSLAAGDNTCDVVLDSKASLTITVKTPNGEPVEDCEIELRREGDVVRSVYSGPDGTVVCEFLEAGEYVAEGRDGNRATRPAGVAVRAGGNDVALVVQEANTVRIVRVTPASQAERAGIREGDYMLAYDGRPVSNFEAMLRLTQEAREKTSVEVRMQRGSEEYTVVLKGGVMGIQAINAVR